jgi:predicted permease
LLLQRRAVKQEIDEELRFHVEQATVEGVAAGMSPEKAAREARKQFGNLQSVREECREKRGANFGESAVQDIRLGMRMLRRNPGFAFVAVSSLAVGLALAAATLATINAYLLRSLPYPTAHRVYHLRYAPPGPYEPRGMTAIDWKLLEDVVEDTITSSGQTFYLMDGGSITTTRSMRVSPGFIRGLGVQPVAGGPFVEGDFKDDGEEAAMIGYHWWRDRFGLDPQIVGRRFQMNRGERGEETTTLRIVGVLPAGFWFGRDSNARVDVLTPLRTRARAYMVRLREGVPVSYAEKRITEVARHVGSDFRPGWKGIELESVHDRYVESIQPVLIGVTLAVGVVLVLVCANVAVLMLLRAMRRQKELAVRVALGAERKHILRILGTEAFLICGAALVLGLALTGMMLRLLTPLIETQLGKPAPGGPSAIHLDATVLFGIGGVSLLIALSLALVPALAPLQRWLANALRSQGTSASDGPSMRRLRASLIACEIGGTLVLLVGCGLMIRSAVNLTNTDLGFNPEQVIRVGVRLPANTDAPAIYRFFSAFSERLPQDPNSRIALMTAFPPFYPANTQRFEAANARNDEAPVGMLRVGAGYFSVYDVPLRQGREFTTADRLGSETVAVISETLARRLWPESSALGRQIRVVEGDMPESPMGPWRTVVGVVGDIRQGYDDADLRDIYLPLLQVPTRFASVHVRTDRPLAFWQESVRAAAKELDPYALVGTGNTIVSEDRKRADTQFLTSMLSGFAVFASLLAVLGIYGVTSYAVQQREREIAIRVSVGADGSAIIRLFLKQGACVLAIGLGLGLLGAFAVARILANQVYGVKPFDLATVATACALMTATCLITIWWPARRAAMRNPMQALKEG